MVHFVVQKVILASGAASWYSNILDKSIFRVIFAVAIVTMKLSDGFCALFFIQMLRI